MLFAGSFRVSVYSLRHAEIFLEFSKVRFCESIMYYGSFCFTYANKQSAKWSTFLHSLNIRSSNGSFLINFSNWKGCSLVSSNLNSSNNQIRKTTPLKQLWCYHNNWIWAQIWRENEDKLRRRRRDNAQIRWEISQGGEALCFDRMFGVRTKSISFKTFCCCCCCCC